MIAPTPARSIAILGATGSIGASALDVIARHADMLNAANEVAVAAFLDQRIGCTQIRAACEETMSRLPPRPLTTLDEARALTRQLLELDHAHALAA